MHKIISDPQATKAGTCAREEAARLAQSAGVRDSAPGQPGPEQQTDFRKLFISERTVANHRLNIMNKCGVKNAAELVKLYLQSTGSL
jgi:hypothetical protein